MRVATSRGPMEVELLLSRPGAPALVVLHELFGPNDDIRRIASRFVANGYTTAIPNLYRGRHWLRCVWGALLTLQRGGGTLVRHLEAVVDALEQRPDVGPVGVVGFCMGGGFAGLLATRRPVKVAGVFYGEPPPREQMQRRMCPTFAGYGLQDSVYGPKGERFAADLAELEVPHEAALYPSCGHGYMNDSGHRVLAIFSRPMLAVAYNEACAEDSWRRMLAFFERHLGAQPVP